MSNFKTETLIKFLDALEGEDLCTNRVNLRANLTLGTGLKIRDVLLDAEFIRSTAKDRRSVILSINPKGLMLLELLRELMGKKPGSSRDEGNL